MLREFAGRFTETVHKPQPLYFYLPHLLHKFAPWSLLLVGLAIVFWRRKTSSRRMQPATLWLVCWSVGGLLLMSVIPSKRVDRIFPVIPPLCLLLGAQIARVARRARRSYAVVARRTDFRGRFSPAATRLGKWERRGAKSGCAGAFLAARSARMAEKNHWRYEVVGGREEGMLLYLRRDHFLSPNDAVQQWNAGQLDALVVPQPAARCLCSPGAKPLLVSEKSAGLPQYSLFVHACKTASTRIVPPLG